MKAKPADARRPPELHKRQKTVSEEAPTVDRVTQTAQGQKQPRPEVQHSIFPSKSAQTGKHMANILPF